MTDLPIRWNVGDVHEHGPGLQSVVVWCHDKYAVLWCADDRMFSPVVGGYEDDEKTDYHWYIAGANEDSYSKFSPALVVLMHEIVRDELDAMARSS